MAVRKTGDLGPGEACDKILELRACLPTKLADAKAGVLARHSELEARILERVPPDLRRRAESRTGRGGRQFELFAPERNGCVRWGLCEGPDLEDE